MPNELQGKRVYISGKITGLDPRIAEELFEQGEEWLKLQGAYPINPMKIQPETEEKTWVDYMLTDMEHLWKCDSIYMLMNWETSNGAKIENKLAELMNLPIYKQTDKHLKDLIKTEMPME